MSALKLPRDHHSLQYKSRLTGRLTFPFSDTVLYFRHISGPTSKIACQMPAITNLNPQHLFQHLLRELELPIINTNT